MEPERYRRIKEVLFGANPLRGEERSAYLDEACGGDTVLRAEVEALLVDDGVSTEDLRPEVESSTAGLFGLDGLRPSPAIPERLGPFVVGAELGRGGMGVVHLAQDTRDDRRVALKLIYPHLVPAPGAMDRFRREARIGRQLRHPNVVRTLDLETFDGDDGVLHALVMEYVEGRTLRALLHDLGTVPEGLLRAIAIQIAAGLEAVHAASIVHRDLKPENVLISDDQHVRIMDLGVARLQATTMELTREGQFLGSLQYASPEQFDAVGVGPRSDLYSLGVLLYELAVGDNPFRSEGAAAVMKAHLELIPPPLHRVQPELSCFFSAVVETLLAKDPEQRVASATALRGLLEAGEDGAWWRERERAQMDREHERAQVPVRRLTAVHGRETELEVLRAAWREAVAGRGCTVLVQGEAGIGKSRLLDAFLETTADDGAHSLYGSFPPDGGLEGILDAIRDRFGAAELERRLEPLLGDLSDLAAPFAALIRDEPLPSVPGRFHADALPRLCATVFTALASERPTVWIVDDLHFAPDGGRDIVLELARAARNERALLVLTSRSDLPPREAAALDRLGSVTRIALGRLSPREVIDLLRDAFHSESVADRLGAKIAYKSDGVPFFVFEMVRSLEESGSIVRGTDGRYAQTGMITDIDVPSAVRELIGARLLELARDERSIVDVGAVQGHEFDAELLAAVLERPLFSVLQDLAEVERRHGVVRSAGRLHRFDHHQFKEVVYASLPPRLREEYHARLAVAFAAGHPSIPDATRPEHAHFLVFHHLHGSTPEAALPHLDAALAYLDSRHLNEPAAGLLERALGCVDLLAGRQRVELQLRLARILDLLGLRDRQEAVIAEALADARALGDGALEASVEISQARMLMVVARAVEGAEVLARAKIRARDAGSDEVLAQAGLWLGACLVRLGKLDEATIELESCKELAEAVGDASTRALVRSELAAVAFNESRFAAARVLQEEALELLVEAGDRAGEARAESRLALANLYLARIDEAREHFQRALDLGSLLGHRSVEAHAVGCLGVVALDQGKLADARRAFLRQRDCAAEIDDHASVAQALVNLAHVSAGLGRREAALAEIEQARALAREIDHVRVHGHCLLYRGNLERDAGDLDTALASMSAALASFREHKDRMHVVEALIDVGEVQILRGEREEGVRALREALELAGEQESREAAAFARIHLAQAGEHDPAEAVAAFEEQDANYARVHRMLGRYQLFRLTGDRTHLESAHETLELLREHAPEEQRDTMVTEVPLHAAIAAAWQSQAGGSGV